MKGQSVFAADTIADERTGGTIVTRAARRMVSMSGVIAR